MIAPCCVASVALGAGLVALLCPLAAPIYALWTWLTRERSDGE